MKTPKFVDSQVRMLTRETEETLLQLKEKLAAPFEKGVKPSQPKSAQSAPSELVRKVQEEWDYDISGLTPNQYAKNLVAECGIADLLSESDEIASTLMELRYFADDLDAASREYVNALGNELDLLYEKVNKAVE